ETFLYPHDLLDDCPTDGPNHWWVLHTRPRAEKSLARTLMCHGAAFFLPQHQHRWRSNGRSFQSHLPLFPSYLFLHGDAETRLTALTTNMVVTAIPVADQRRLHEDLVRVHQLMVSGAPLTPEEGLLPGDPVEVIHGPFAGMHGKVI